MGEGVEIWKGSVAQWECDAMGHLNIGFYATKSIEALAGLAAELGMPRAFAPDALATLLVREQHFRFIREARPGAPLTMTGGVLEIGETEARLLMVLRHAAGELAATFQIVVAHVTAADGRPFPWPRRVIDRAAALMAQVPEGAGPRGVALNPVESRASLKRADALGIARTALGALTPADCDVFGRMRPDRLMSRIAEGLAHLFAKERSGSAPGDPRGGAAVEYRLVYLEWPRAGDRVELRSGVSGSDAKLRRMIHWLLDPESGRAWGVAEAVAVSFDLTTRKVIILDDEAQALAQKQVVEGLTL